MVEPTTAKPATDAATGAPLDAAHARIGELIREYGSQCAAYHFGPHVTRAYQACMAEIEKQMGVA